MENVGCRRRSDDVHALILHAAQRAPHGPFGLRLGPEVLAMLDSGSADYGHRITLWPPGVVEMPPSKSACFDEGVVGLLC